MTEQLRVDGSTTFNGAVTCTTGWFTVSMTDQTDSGIIVEATITTRDSKGNVARRDFEYAGGSSVEDAANRLRGGFIGSIDQKIKPVGDKS